MNSTIGKTSREPERVPKVLHYGHEMARLCRQVLHLILGAICMLGFVSCLDNDGVGTPTGGSVPVSIHVSADLLGDLNATRATGVEDPGESGEFMHTLCVFVVDESGTIEAKFGPDLLVGYTAAQTGDLTDWTSEEFVLPTGTKTIYAFSNWQTADSENDDWAALIKKEVGETITSTDLRFAVDDPASKVDIENGKYIPMSGKETVVVYDLDADLNHNAQLFSVGLDRLVGKVRVKVQDETGDGAEDVTIKGISFMGCADKVPMMSDDDTEDYEITYDKGYDTTYDEGIKVATNGTTLSFYVNETYRSNVIDETTEEEIGGFTISLDTDEYGGLTYTATTVNEDIPRNYIYPIMLTLDSYELVLEPQAWTSILGVDAELEYDSPITVDGDTYYITMLDVTSTFSITPSLTYSKGDAPAANWTWTYVDEDGEEITSPECTVTMGDDGVLNVTTLTATPGYEYGFTLEVAWTESSSNSIAHSRTYNVKVVFEEGFPSIKKASRAWWTRGYGSELLRLRVRQ